MQPLRPGLCHFERIGLPQRFAQAADAIDAAWRERMAAVHPDRFADAAPFERRFAAEHAAALNDARRVLALPASRLGYLLALRGVEGARTPAEQLRPDSTDLIELIELNQALGELRGRDATVERARLARAIQERFEGLLFELGAVLDATPEAEIVPIPPARLAHLSALRRLIDEAGSEAP